jgi:hypothetical protein
VVINLKVIIIQTILVINFHLIMDILIIIKEVDLVFMEIMELINLH